MVQYMEKYIEQNGITYELRGEQYYPLLELPEQKEIGKYGRLLTSEFVGNSVLFNVLFHILHRPFLWCFKCTTKTKILQMYRLKNTRNVLKRSRIFSFRYLVSRGSRRC